MGERKHTPGPWHVEDPMGDICLSIVDDAEQTYDWKMVANVTWSGKDEKGQKSFVSYKTAEANAHLIAAAPDLLRELDMQVRNCPVCKGEGMAVDIFDMLSNDDRPLEKKPCQRCASSRAAIAKAEGQP